MDHSLAAMSPDAGLSNAGQAPPVRTGPRDPGDAWVEGAQGRFWGRFGAAGVLAYDPDKGVLLQHRAAWSHNGGTWGLPGGALHQGEDAVAGALREAHEEAAVPAKDVSILFTSVLDVGYWSYTTVVLLVRKPFDPVISDPESIELRWVPLSEVESNELHPGFGAVWPELRRRMLELAEGGIARATGPGNNRQ
jgi:8-oxo-dGTP diphosphatase